MYKKINADNLIIEGSSYEVEDKVTGNIYISSKSYIDKLFKSIGYKNLHTVQILEEYTNKSISSVGDSGSFSVYVDDTTYSFIVATDSAMSKLEKLKKLLYSKYDIIRVMNYDNMMSYDEYLIKTPNEDNTTYAIYIDMVREEVVIYSVALSDQEGLTGVYKYDKFKFESDSFIDDIIMTLSLSYDSKVPDLIDKNLSYRECIELFKILGYVKLRKKICTLTDYGFKKCVEEGKFISIEQYIDEYNLRSNLVRCIETPGFTYEESFKLIREELPNIMIYELSKYFKPFYTESTDMCELNN